jgi:pyruvate formate lyase activating enzyme
MTGDDRHCDVTRFYPQHQMTDLPPTPISTLERAYNIGRKTGLKFVYTGNVPGHQNENTVCYSCGKLNVQRYGYETTVSGLKGSTCKYCGAELNFQSSRLKGGVK